MWEHSPELVQTLCSDAQPTQLVNDFEKAAINSFRLIWYNTNFKGCFFHLTQNIWRKVQAEGLQSDYNNDEELALKIRHLPTLAFVSPFNVRDYFETVIEHLPNPGLKGLVLYFEQTYIGRTLAGGFHQEPLFLIQMWNQHHEVARAC